MPSAIAKHLTVFVLASLLAVSYGASATAEADKKVVLAVSGMT